MTSSLRIFKWFGVSNKRGNKKQRTLKEQNASSEKFSIQSEVTIISDFAWSMHPADTRSSSSCASLIDADKSNASETAELTIR